MTSVPAGSRPVLLFVLSAFDRREPTFAALDLVRFLVRAGWRVLVAGQAGPLGDELRRGGAEVHELDPGMGGVLARLAGQDRLGRLARTERARLVHAFEPALAAPALRAARAAGAPLVVSVDAPVREARLLGPLAEAQRLCLLFDPDAIVAEDAAGLPRETSRFVPRGVDLARFDPASIGGPRLAAIAERWGVAPEEPIVLVPGRIASGGGHLAFVRALARLERRDFTCVLMGEIESGGYLRQLEALIGTTGLGERIRLPGSSDDLPAAFHLADVVVVPPTEAPPFGRAVAEAQAMGKPVIANDVGGLGACLMPAATGWLIAPDRPDDLAEALDLALAMPVEVRRRVAERARGFARRELDGEAGARRLVQVYRELLPDVPGFPAKDATLAA